MKKNEKSTFNKKFMRRCVLNGVCAVVTILLMIIQKNMMWMMFTMIFVMLAITNLFFARKHRNEVDLGDVIIGKIINRKLDDSVRQQDEMPEDCEELTDDMEEAEKTLNDSDTEEI